MKPYGSRVCKKTYPALFCYIFQKMLDKTNKKCGRSPLIIHIFKEVSPMSNYSVYVKKKLLDTISELDIQHNLFLYNPGKDYIRERKLSFSTIVELLLSVEGNCLGKELLGYFDYDKETVSVSAFVQQRAKILPDAFDFLFHEFTDTYNRWKKYKDYRLIACDGTDLNIAHNPQDKDTYFIHAGCEKGYNQLHLNAFYDLYNRMYTDALIQPGRKTNECGALINMIDRSKIRDKVIIMADRGYESYNVFAHAEKKGWKYLIRVRDKNSNCCMLSAINLPDTEEFDIEMDLELTKKQTNAVKDLPNIYKILSHNTPFDYLDLHKDKFYPMKFRIVRFPITEKTYECIITNLDKYEFPSDEIKKLYHMRWGIETSFRELKYAIGITNFHAKKVAYVMQEIFTRLTMYNFCEMITTNVVIKQKSMLHTYQVNFTMAIYICKHFFRCKHNIHPPNIEALIQKYILPVREGRNDPRKVRPQTAVSFLYRVA